MQPNLASRAARAAALSLAGAVLALTAARLPLHRSPLAGRAALAAFGVLGLAAALAFRARRGDRPGAVLCAAALLIGAFAFGAAVEVPAWPAAAAFGRSAAAGALAIALLAILLAAAPRRLPDALATLLVGTAAFGGAPFAGDGDEYFRIALPLSGLLLLALASERHALSRLPFAGALALFAASALPALALAPDAERHAAGLSRLLAAVALFAAIASGPPDPARARPLLLAIAGGLLVGAGAAVAAVAEAAAPLGLALARATPLTLFGQHANVAAAFPAAAAPLLLPLLGRGEPRRARALGLAGLAAAALVLAATRSRTAVLAAAVGMATALAIALASGRLAGRRRAFAVVATAVLGAGPALALLAVLAARADPALEFRSYLWATAAEAIGEHPLAGHGFLTGEPLVAHAAPSAFDGRPKDTHPHNQFLALALGAGIPAAAALLVLYLLLLGRGAALCGSTSRPRTRALASGVVGSGAALLFTGWFDAGLALATPLPLLLGALLGLLALLLQSERELPFAASAAPAARAPSRALAALALLLPLLAVPALAARLVDWAGELRRAGAGEAATRAVRAARALMPRSFAYSNHVVAALRAAGDRSAALAAGERLAAAHPRNAEAAAQLARCRAEAGDARAALEAARKGLELDRTSQHVGFRQGELARYALRAGDRATFAAALSLALAAGPEHARGLPWEHAEPDGWRVLLPDGSAVPLTAVVAENRARALAELGVRPWIARRVAQATAQLLLDFGCRAEAAQWIAEFDATAGDSALAIDFLHGADSNVPARTAAGIEAEVQRARAALAQGDLAAAAEGARRALREARDLAAERTEIAAAAAVGLGAALAAGDDADAVLWLERGIYAVDEAGPAVDGAALVLQALARGGDRERSAAAVRRALELVRRLDYRPTRTSAAALSDLGSALAAVAGDAALRAPIERLLPDVAAGRTAEIALAGLYFSARGDRARGDRLLAAVLSRDPEQARALGLLD